jgi:hypothetical protein
VEEATDAQRRKLEALVDRVDQDPRPRRWPEFEARLAKLREQQGKARENQRQRIDARIDELKASHEGAQGQAPVGPRARKGAARGHPRGARVMTGRAMRSH